MSIYAVNGKEPVSVWIPTLDNSGNGTTTLNDLVGSSDGTLVDFALSGSTSNWVADTDNGGVRALDFDGTNDHVTIPNPTTETSNLSVSFWLRLDTGSYEGPILWKNYHFGIKFYSVPNRVTCHWWDGSDMLNIETSGNLTSVGTWIHYVFVVSSNAIQELYEDGAAVGVDFSPSTASRNTGNNITLGTDNVGMDFLDGRLDDVRIFNSALDSSDVAYLYNSGSGRGRVTGSGKKTFFMGAAW